MKLSSIFAIAALAAPVAILSSSFDFAQAATMSTDITLTNFTGDPAQVSVTLTEITGAVQFDLSIDRPETINGDLFGFFASVKDDRVSPFTSITGSDVTDFEIDANNVLNLGGGNNLNGYKGTKFDFGVTFGESGGSGGLIEQTSFTVSGLTLADFEYQNFGARLQSVGDNEGGSSKLSGDSGDFTGETQIPEPVTMLGTLTAIGIGAGLKRKARQAEDSANV